MFSRLKPKRLNKNKGKQRVIKTYTLIVKENVNVFKIKNISAYQTILIIAVE